MLVAATCREAVIGAYKGVVDRPLGAGPVGTMGLVGFLGLGMSLM
jgi:hypothetical protein